MYYNVSAPECDRAKQTKEVSQGLKLNSISRLVFAPETHQHHQNFEMALRKVKGNFERMFDKNLTDLVRGIRNNKNNEVIVGF